MPSRRVLKDDWTDELVVFALRGFADIHLIGHRFKIGGYELSSMTVWRFVDGKIAEEWVFLNELDL